jgi:hypothetical protein
MVREEFTVTEIRNVRTGEAVNSTTTRDVNRQTANVSATQKQIQQLIELQQQLAEQEANAATGSGGGGLDLGFSGLGSIGVGGALIAGGAALFILGKD